MTEVVVTAGAVRRAVKLSPQTNQHPDYNRPDALPVAQPTDSEHRRRSALLFTVFLLTLTRLRFKSPKVQHFTAVEAEILLQVNQP